MSLPHDQVVAVFLSALENKIAWLCQRVGWPMGHRHRPGVGRRAPGRLMATHAALGFARAHIMKFCLVDDDVAIAVEQLETKWPVGRNFEIERAVLLERRRAQQP